MDFSEYKKNVIDVTPESDGLLYALPVMWLHLDKLPVGVCGLGNCADKVIKIPNMSKKERVVQFSTGPQKIVAPPVKVITFSSRTFSRNNNITDIILQSNIEKIPGGSFYGCSALERITIPKLVKEIKACTFEDCTSLTDIYYEGTCEEWKQIKIDMTEDVIKKENIDKSREKHIAGNMAVKNAEIHFNCIL